MPRALKTLGTIIACAFLVWILLTGFKDMPAVDLTSIGAHTQLFGAFGFYCLSQVIGAFAWRQILGVWSVSLSPGRAESQHLVSQIGKYVPGNVGQFVGRFALARQDGVASPIIGLAMLFEVVMLIGTGALVVAGLLAILPGLADALLASNIAAGISEAFWVFPAVASFAAVGAGGLLFRETRRRDLPAAHPLRLAVPVVLYVGNFLALGASLSLVARVVSPDIGVSIEFATAVFALAWVAGFVIPGAPGGVGIRDGLLAIGLGLAIGEGPGLAVALLHRGVSVAGDVGIFGIGWFMRRHARVET